MSDAAQPPTPPSTPPSPPPRAWTPPADVPFGVPAATTGAPAPTPAHGAPGPHPPGAHYAPPAGYVLPQAAASGPRPGAPAPVRRGRTVGVIALVLSLVAVAGASLLGAIASFRIGLGAGRELTARPIDAGFDWAVLSPVREWVLTGEIAFWVGTVLGIWALVQGIVAIVTGRGRGAGIAAVIVAALGPFVFGAVVQGFLSAGLAAGTGIGG